MKRLVYRLIIAISILSFLISCGSKNKNWEKDVKSVEDMLRKFDHEVKLSSEIYIDDTVQLLNPFVIEIVDDYLLISEIGPTEKGILSVYDMKNQQFIGRMLNFGNGPNELLGLRMNNYGKDTLLALDPFRKTAQLFSASDLRTCNGIPSRTIKYRSPQKGEQIDQSYLFDNKLICSGQFQKNRFQVYDTKGKYLASFGEFPAINSGNIQLDNIQLGSLSGGNASFANNLQQSRIACLSGSSLSIYDCEKEKVDFSGSFFCQWYIFNATDARYMGGKPVVLGDNKVNRVGAGSLTSTDNYLFFTFSYLTISDILEMEHDNRYQYILVTNWNGDPVAKLVLDKAIHFPLEIDKDGKYLYAIHTDTKTGYSKILRYDISSL